MSEVLLARYAGCIFWLARYVERAENLARILDVNETFARDSRGGQNWMSIVELYSDREEFLARHQTASASSVLRFYVTDAGNSASLISAVRAARENARILRPVISTEMWVQINMFYRWLDALPDSALAPGQLAHLFNRIKESCQTHTGIIEGTFYRDQGWYFYQLGRYVERADQTTRLLDMKYHLLLPDLADVGSPIDVGQWNALLRSAAGYHAYRWSHSTGEITPSRVGEFLLLNRRFPRSVYLCVRETEMLLAELKSRYSLPGGNKAAEELDSLRALLSSLTINAILRQGLHEFLDLIQVRLAAATRDLSVSFFGEKSQQSQSQLQTAAV